MLGTRIIACHDCKVIKYITDESDTKLFKKNHIDHYDYEFLDKIENYQEERCDD